MKKLLALAFLIITNNAIAASTAAPMMMSAAAVSMAASASVQANRAANTVGLGILTGKQIENCLILTSYYADSYLVIVCLHKEKDEIYRVKFYKPKGAFSQGVFNELRKQFKGVK
jgi:hypothetical protein